MKNFKFPKKTAALILSCLIMVSLGACSNRAVQDNGGSEAASIETSDTAIESKSVREESSSELTESKADSDTNDDTDGYTKMYIVKSVTAKSSPNDDARDSNSLSAGTLVFVKYVGSDWYEVKTNNNVCYVKGEYLSTEKDSVVSDITSSSSTGSAVSSKSGSSTVESQGSTVYQPSENVTTEIQWEQPAYVNDNSNVANAASSPANNTQNGGEASANVSVPTVSAATRDPNGKKLVVIDAGHQSIIDLNTEPVGPGASEMKIKDSGGTKGTTTGKPEYQLNLELALKLQTILEERGYEVIQVRTENEVDLGNIDRATIANNAGADAFIRIHANGSDSPYVSGAMTLCQTPNNPYNGDIYNECKSLSEKVLDELVAATGCNKEYVWETDTMCGINWARVPVTIVEVGYMTNPQEDLLLSTDEYQEKVCKGIANGIDRFISEQ